MDKRYRDIAKGVGQSEIVGRVHVAPLKIGQIFYPCSFTVLDLPDLEFTFGLDMLRKHQCSIDLKNNVLQVGGGEISVPFLQAENQLPLHLHDDKRLEEPSSSGPSGATVNVHPPAPIYAPGGPVSTHESHESQKSSGRQQSAEADGAGL
jgi:DNA damage-inducible protein 1